MSTPMRSAPPAARSRSAALDTAIAKARLGMATSGASPGLATEDNVGPDPAIGKEVDGGGACARAAGERRRVPLVRVARGR
jgi:hypothetical protein